MSYRFCGEVAEWPPAWDPTGTDVYCSITASGVLRRLSQGNLLGSALHRFWTSQTGVLAPVAYWPCEDLAGATSLGSGTGGAAMSVDGKPTLASSTAFLSSEAIPQLSSSTWTGLVSTAQLGSSSVVMATQLLHTGAGLFTPSGVTNWVNVSMWAPGAPGGGSNSDTWGGGGGGAFVYAPYYPVVPGIPIPWSIPAPGAGGTNGPGVTSGPATFGDLTAYSGAVGSTTSGGPGGGGTSQDPSVNPGGQGGAPGASGGGGGSGGGTGGAGGAGQPGLTNGGAGGAAAGGGTGGYGGGGAGTATGAGTKTSHVGYYNATATYSYTGAGNLMGTAYLMQGDDGLNDNGNTYSFIVFNYNQIRSDLAGATVTEVDLKLQNEWSYYSSGMYVTVGWGTQTSFGSTAPAVGPNVDGAEWWTNRYQLLAHNIGGVGLPFQSTATCLILYKNVSSQYNYGYFSGATQTNPPQLQISYVK